MKCQILFSGKNKKNIIDLLSAKNAQRVVKVNNTSTLVLYPREREKRNRRVNRKGRREIEDGKSHQL